MKKSQSAKYLSFLLIGSGSFWLWLFLYSTYIHYTFPFTLFAVSRKIDQLRIRTKFYHFGVTTIRTGKPECAYCFHSTSPLGCTGATFHFLLCI